MDFKCTTEGCENKDKTEYWQKVSIGIVEGKNIYRSNGKEIVCKICGKPLFYEEKFDGYGKFYGGFSGKSYTEKREILKKRERCHQARDKNFHEYKKAKDNGEI